MFTTAGALAGIWMPLFWCCFREALISLLQYARHRRRTLHILTFAAFDVVLTKYNFLKFSSAGTSFHYNNVMCTVPRNLYE